MEAMNKKREEDQLALSRTAIATPQLTTSMIQPNPAVAAAAMLHPVINHQTATPILHPIAQPHNPVNPVLHPSMGQPPNSINPSLHQVMIQTPNAINPAIHPVMAQPGHTPADLQKMQMNQIMEMAIVEQRQQAMVHAAIQQQQHHAQQMQQKQQAELLMKQQQQAAAIMQVAQHHQQHQQQQQMLMAQKHAQLLKIQQQAASRMAAIDSEEKPRKSRWNSVSPSIHSPSTPISDCSTPRPHLNGSSSYQIQMTPVTTEESSKPSPSVSPKLSQIEGADSVAPEVLKEYMKQGRIEAELCVAPPIDTSPTN